LRRRRPPKKIHKFYYLFIFPITIIIILYAADMITPLFKSALLKSSESVAIPIGKHTTRALEAGFIFTAGAKAYLEPVQETARLEEQVMRETTYSYHIKVGKRAVGRLSLTLQEIDGENAIYFISCHAFPGEAAPATAKLTISGSAPPRVIRTIEYPGGIIDNRQSRWKEIKIGPLPCSLPRSLTFIESQDCSLALGMIDVFQDLGNGVIKELYHQSPAARVRTVKNETRYEIPLPGLPGTESRAWGVIALKPLVDWKNNTPVDRLRVADLNRFHKFWIDGVYYLTPESYVPSDPRGFWRCPAHHVGEAFLRTPGELTRALAISSMYAAIRTQNPSGYWPTTPKSNWLAEDYGFGPGFYDTRFNTDGAIFLLRAYQAFGEPQALNAAERYAAFLCSFARLHARKTPRSGYLVPDYMDARGRAETHTSLNHLVTEMNFLYELFLATGKEEYKAVAENIRLAVKDTRDGWIKPDGNLWYARLLDGRFGLQDYPTLTLNDLRLAQRWIQEIEGEPDPDFQILINTKTRYNRSHGLPL